MWDRTARPPAGDLVASFVSLSPAPSGLALHFFTGPRNRQGSFATRIIANADDGGGRRHRKRDFTGYGNKQVDGGREAGHLAAG